MKNIKNLFLLMILGILLVAPLVATSIYEPTTDMYKQTGEPFEGTSTRVMGMGGSGIGVSGYYDSFLFNPANLGAGNLKVSLPAITVTAFNPKAILESGMFDAIENDDPVTAAQEFLGTIDSEYGDVLTTDVSVVLGLGGFGLALEAQERLMSYKTGSDLTTTNLIAQVTMAATAGLGFRINAVPDYVSIDLGVSAKAVYKMYLAKQNANTVSSMFATGSDPADTYLNDVPLVAGYSFPVNVGMNLNLPLGLTVSAVARNFNGTYYMSTYQSLNDWSEEVLGEAFDTDTSDDSLFTSEEFTTDAGWTLNAGLTWAPKVSGLLRPIISVDVLDIMELSGLEGEDLTAGLLEQSRLGASLRVLSILDLRYGLSQGYQSVGVGFDLLIFHLDAAYYTMEYGTNVGDNAIDAVSLRFSLLSR
jgi:hypothetical protein